MAKKRTKSVRRARASPKRASSRRGSSKGKVSMLQFDSMIYGALRQKASTALTPFTSKIPLGSISDELGMGALNYFIAKKTTGMLRDIAMKGLVIENARVGEAVVDGSLNLGFLGGQTTSNSSNGGYPV